MPHIFSTRAFVIDSLPKGHHLLEPVIGGARRQTQLIARFTNRLAFDKDETAEFRLLRLCRMVDPPAEAAVYHETPLAIRIYATPPPRTRTVASPTLCFSAAEDARRVGDCGADSIPREDQVEQRVEKVFLALLPIARPHDEGALRIRSCNWKFPGTLVPAVQAMDERSCHFRIEFKIKVAHGWISIVLPQYEAGRLPLS